MISEGGAKSGAGWNRGRGDGVRLKPVVGCVLSMDVQPGVMGRLA